MAAAASGHPHFLSGLTTREAIADALIRACLAIDVNDRALWESAWAIGDADVVFDLNGRVMRGMEAINAGFFHPKAALDSQHLVTGLRIDVQEGASTARVTAQALNQHFRPGQGMHLGSDHLLGGGLYDVEAVKDASGQWKLKTWKLKTHWAQGDVGSDADHGLLRESEGAEPWTLQQTSTRRWRVHRCCGAVVCHTRTAPA